MSLVVDYPDMGMQIKDIVSHREFDDVAIVDFVGPITCGTQSRIFKEYILSLISKGIYKIILNMAQVTDIDACGIGEIVSAYVRVVAQHGNLKLLSPYGRAEEVLGVARLLTSFEVFKDEKVAIESFNL